MLTTAFPDQNGLNKPAFFYSPDGKTWNGSPEPCTASERDIVVINGYKYDSADINGMNTLLYEDRKYFMYFCDFKNPGHIFRAVSTDGHNYANENEVLSERMAVNDVKKFKIANKPWYLMGLHMNTDHLSYSVSSDPLHFPPAKTLFDHLDATDRYMVAIGFVCQGGQELPGRHVLGVLYGAGASPNLAENRIFARWLQKRIVLKAAGKTYEPTHSFGPDRQILSIDAGAKFTGRFEIYAEDNKTLLGQTEQRTWEAGQTYAIVFD
jgi:hypothetical protein